MNTRKSIVDSLVGFYWNHGKSWKITLPHTQGADMEALHALGSRFPVLPPDTGPWRIMTNGWVVFFNLEASAHKWKPCLGKSWFTHIHSSILLPYSLSRSHKQPCDFVCAMVVYLGTCPAAQQHPEWKYITVCINMYIYTIYIYIIYIGLYMIYMHEYMCVWCHCIDCQMNCGYQWISMEHRIHRCKAFASAFWCATPVLKLRVNSSPQSSQSDANSHGGFIHSDFNKGKQAQNDAKRYKATTIYCTLISLIIWTRFIRPVSGSTTGPPLFPALEGSIFRTEICVQQQLWGNYVDGCIHCQGQAWDASTEMK